MLSISGITLTNKKRPPGCEWDDSGRTVTQKHVGHASQTCRCRRENSDLPSVSRVVCLSFDPEKRAAGVQRSATLQEQDFKEPS